MDRRTVVAGLIAAFALACSGPAGELAGGAIQDAGDALAGIGGAMSEAGMGGLGGTVAGIGGAMAGMGGVLAGKGGSGAAGGAGVSGAMAQPMGTVITAACDIQSGRRDTDEGGNGTSSVARYAEVDVSGFDPVDLVGAAFVLCDYRDPVPLVSHPCVRGVCNDIGTYPRPTDDCSVQTSFAIRDGKASIHCGAVSKSISTGTETVVYDYSWNNVRFVLR